VDDRHEEEPHHPDDLERDLSKVLQKLMSNGKKQDIRRRLANDPLTRAYLDAGLYLVAKQLEIQQPQPQLGQQDDGNPPFFEWLGRDEVLEEATRRDEGRLVPSEGTFRHRWKYQPDYVSDLLAYALSPEHWTAHVGFDRQLVELLSSTGDLAEAIEEISYRDLCALLENPANKITLLASVGAAKDPRAREIIGDTYKFVNAGWERLYQATFDSLGLKLRKGVSLQEFGDILAALADGIAVRQMGDAYANFIDHEQRTSLLGKAVLAVVAGCIDIGDGMTLPEVVNLIMKGLKES
jgi:hypothetical protein